MQSPEAARAAIADLTASAVLRMANRLSLNVSSRTEEYRRQHGAYVSGAIGLALSLDLLEEDHALLLRVVCRRLLDAPMRSTTRPSEAADAEGEA